MNNRTQLKTIDSIALTTDYVANGSFASLKTHVSYLHNNGYAILVRLTDYHAGWTGPFTYVSEPAYSFLSKSALNIGDIVIANVGANIGTVFLVPDLGQPMTLGPNSVLLRTITEHQPYLYFYLSSAQGQAQLKTIMSGSAQPKFNKTELRGLRIPLPPLSTQKQIASILSAYNELIENNERRIKILKDMAQSIYREWFVNFRFPGHENVKMVESELGLIPEGWEVNTLAELCHSISDGDWIETKDQGGADYRLVQVGNIGMDRFIETNNQRYIDEETYNRLSCHALVPGDILVARMPDPIGRAWMVRHLPSPMITAVDVAILKPDINHVDTFYLLQSLNSSYALTRIAAFATGTTRPRVTRRDLAIQAFLVPPISVQTEFGGHAKLIKSEIDQLEVKNINLRKTRDLLLPKLISGQIDVEDLDIKVA